ncbi:MAG TPA: hypothetical protein VJ608_15160 [Albitalea sp.]|nr:hypothetical protein [Albitalea sp.]
MDFEQLMGRYSRLQHELSVAYATQPWPSALIDRLSADVAATERAIAALQPADEQYSEPLPRVVNAPR